MDANQRVKLLFDENLSPRLPGLVDDFFPGSSHVREHGLEQRDDRAIFDFASRADFVLVSKDKDFLALTAMLGPPPKFIQIMIGNCSVSAIARLLRERRSEILAFEASPVRKILLLR